MKQILFDCDPGHDDVLAILMALASPELHVLGIVTSAGNQTVAKTTQNALKLCSFLNIRNVPVVRGVAHPILRPLIVAQDVHGETGLDGADFGPVTLTALEENPIEFMARTLREAPDPVTIVVTGPMTNTALLLSVYPELRSKIGQISFMGGACFGGNKTPLAEYNIYVDPEAAQVVFQSGIPLVMSGLDVTLKAQIFPDEIDRIRSLGNKAGTMVADLLCFFNRTTTPNFLTPDKPEGAHLHDPCAIAVLTNPEKFLCKDLYGYVATDGVARGCTVIDYDGSSGSDPNVRVAFDLDREWFIGHLTDCISRFE